MDTRKNIYIYNKKIETVRAVTRVSRTKGSSDWWRLRGGGKVQKHVGISW